MPIVHITLPRRTLDLRTILEHTWLKRRLLAQLRENGKQWAIDANAPIPGVLRGIPPRLVEARNLISSLTTIYCPARLVRDGPLSNLPRCATKIIEDVLQREFLNLNIIQPLKEEAEVSLKEVERIAEILPQAWNSLQFRGEMLNDLALAGERLRAALAALPSGVVVP